MLPGEEELSFLRGLRAEDFAQADAKLADGLLGALRSLFKAARDADEQGVGSGLTELCTEGFEKEQLWAMIQLENEPMLEYLQNTVDSLVDRPKFSLIEGLEQELAQRKRLVKKSKGKKPVVDEESEDEDDEEEDDEEAKEDSEGPSMSDASEVEEEKAASEEEEEEEDEDDDDEDEDEEEEGESSEESEEDEENPDLHGKTELDDDFFRFADMEKFVESVAQEDAEMKMALNEAEKAKGDASKGPGKAGADDDYSDDGELSGGEDEDEYDDSDPEEEGGQYKFTDFWGGSRRGKKEPKKGKVKRKSIEEEDEDEIEDEDEDVEDEEDMYDSEEGDTVANDTDGFGADTDDLEGPMSTHEKRQLEIKQQIEELKAEALGDKSWEMKGEAHARKRPQNSLLEKGDLDVGYISKPAPTITEDSTRSLEDIIKQRILDGDFDDVERKLPPAQDADYKPKAELSVEKSNVGLADEYAKEYEETFLGHTPEAVAKRTKEQNEIMDMFSELCGKLDALTNFHFTPKPPSKSDGEIRPVNVSAIHMEEALPVTESAANHAAPEEVLATKRGRDGVGKTTEEMDQQERKSARRSSKAAKRARKRALETEKRVVSKLRPGLGNKHAKTAALNSGADDNVKWSKSSDVFKKIQEAMMDPSAAAEATFKRSKSDAPSRSSSGAALRLA
mmetsp:Transcript_10122/g.18604  ORF Transcript_10122/g.18604 Transcript_10122/m.18604 type:complete len:677 (+) Transcript_10122:104-2134(+)